MINVCPIIIFQTITIFSVNVVPDTSIYPINISGKRLYVPIGSSFVSCSLAQSEPTAPISPPPLSVRLLPASLTQVGRTHLGASRYCCIHSSTAVYAIAWIRVGLSSTCV